MASQSLGPQEALCSIHIIIMRLLASHTQFPYSFSFNVVLLLPVSAERHNTGESIRSEGHHAHFRLITLAGVSQTIETVD